jgi:hypothetical protein
MLSWQNECGCDDGSCAACAPRPNTAEKGRYGNGWPIPIPLCSDASNAALEHAAYWLLARLEESDISDAELDRLFVVSTELDRRGVPYQGRVPGGGR